MTLTERAASLFGEIAAAAGYFEATMGFAAQHVLLSKEHCDTLLAYFNTTKPFCASVQINNRTTRDRLVMVSGLEVHLIRGTRCDLRVG